ncbi:MAG: T9SS type A sorting domain-containing protein [Bacteroidetes bacterium]|nr:T9SS type A sorting domain-containing protein [Bacteroidota bacterium]
MKKILLLMSAMLLFVWGAIAQHGTLTSSSMTMNNAWQPKGLVEARNHLTTFGICAVERGQAFTVTVSAISDTDLSAMALVFANIDANVSYWSEITNVEELSCGAITAGIPFTGSATVTVKSNYAFPDALSRAIVSIWGKNSSFPDNVGGNGGTATATVKFTDVTITITGNRNCDGQIYGCMDKTAINYNPNATIHVAGDCEYYTSTVDKSALRATIQTANYTLVGAPIGCEYSGCRPAFAAVALQNAIDAAQAVEQDIYATPAQVLDAKIALIDAIDAFSAAKITCDYYKLAALITEAQNIYITATIGNQPGQYSEFAKNDFAAAIQAANSVNNDYHATQIMIDRAIAALNEAITKFKMSAVPIDSDIFGALNLLIAKIQYVIDDARIYVQCNGDGYPVSAYTQINQRLNAAKAAKAKATTQPEVDKIYDDLLVAYGTFLNSWLIDKCVDIYGCMNPAALNYNPNATIPNNSCVFNTISQDKIGGCTDTLALNFNPIAAEDNGRCVYQAAEVAGCMYKMALNYNEKATIDDNSCVFATPENVYIYVGEEIIKAAEQIFSTIVKNACNFDFNTPIDTAYIAHLKIRSDGTFLATWLIEQGDNVTVIQTVYSEKSENAMYYLSLICNSTTNLLKSDNKIQAITIGTLFKGDEIITGCMNPDADNYRPEANEDGKNCIYTAVKVVDAQEIIVYPNPTAGMVYVSTASEIKVFSAQGALLIATFGTSVDLSSFANGVYFVQVGGAQVKVVKQ